VLQNQKGLILSPLTGPRNHITVSQKDPRHFWP